MDIISHSLSGVAVGTVFATLSKANWKTKAGIFLLGGLGGALPDLDAISLWSKFDATIGSFFNLKHSGKQIYFGKFWYSHHAAFHSLLTPIIFIFVSLLLAIITRKKFKAAEMLSLLKQKQLLLLTFFFSFFLHLLEDMPTPASVWGGVNLFFPSKTYVGGFGKIWWWNNYDLVLIIVGIILINLLLNVFPKQHQKLKATASIFVFFIGFTLGIIQINNRPIDFGYAGHTTNYQQLEAKSKQIQKDILGEKLFQVMNTIDNHIPLNF